MQLCKLPSFAREWAKIRNKVQLKFGLPKKNDVIRIISFDFFNNKFLVSKQRAIIRSMLVKDTWEVAYLQEIYQQLKLYLSKNDKLVTVCVIGKDFSFMLNEDDYENWEFDFRMEIEEESIRHLFLLIRQVRYELACRNIKVVFRTLEEMDRHQERLYQSAWNMLRYSGYDIPQPKKMNFLALNEIIKKDGNWFFFRGIYKK